MLQVVSGAFATIVPQGRWKIISTSAGQAFNTFSNYTFGSDANDCLADSGTAGTRACKTAARALYLACNEIDISGTDAVQTSYIVNLAANVQDQAGVHYACPATPGGQGGVHFVLNGGVNATIFPTGAGVDAVGAFVGANLLIKNLVLASTSGSCVRALYQGRIFIASGVPFSVCGVSWVTVADGGNVYLQSTIAIEGNATDGFVIGNGGGFFIDPIGQTINVNFAANVSFTNFIRTSVGGNANWQGAVFNLGGFTAIGRRVSQGSGSNIFTGAGGPACLNTFFPGTSNGFSDGTGSCL